MVVYHSQDCLARVGNASRTIAVLRTLCALAPLPHLRASAALGVIHLCDLMLKNY